MRQWLKHKAKRVFDFVDRKDHEYMWERRREMTAQHAALVASFEALSNCFTRLALQLEHERKINGQLILERAIVNVAPLEAMDRALDILTVLEGSFRVAGDSPSPLDRAISELKHGIELMHKQPSVGGRNGNSSQTA